MVNSNSRRYPLTVKRHQNLCVKSPKRRSPLDQIFSHRVLLHFGGLPRYARRGRLLGRNRGKRGSHGPLFPQNFNERFLWIKIFKQSIIKFMVH